MTQAPVAGAPLDGDGDLVPTAEDARAALAELHQARRRNHREVVHWIDALYKAYLTALVAAGGVIVASSWFPDRPLDASEVTELATVGPAWVGLAIAIALAVGLRSGGRGGPLALEPSTVFHELLAPIDRGAALRRPAIQQLRFLAFAGAVLGATAGVLAARRLPTVNALELVVAGTVTFAAAAALSSAAAMVMSGRRLGIWVANGLAVLFVGWAAIDVAAGTVTSPTALLGDVAFWPLQVRLTGIIGLLLVGAVVVLAISGLAGTSIEQARARAGLVTQLRFAVTLQDIRTVVLLRRQLTQEGARTRPWLGMRRAGRLPAVWRRDWACYLRFPAVRLVRLLTLGVAAGVALGVTWRGTTPAFLVAAFALFLAGYEAVEPLAQETDHPTRWDALGGDWGNLLLRHLPAATALMVLVGLVAAGVALVLVPAHVVLDLGIIVLLPTAIAAAVGAAVSTVQSTNTSSTLMDAAEMSNSELQMTGLDPSTMGFVQVFRLAIAPAMVVAALAPLLAAGSDPEAVDTARVSNLMLWPLLLSAAGVLWLRVRRPSRI